MTKNPYLNALIGIAYIVFVVCLITFGPVLVRNKPDTILAPIAMLSLLSFSVAFMGYTFFGQPILMFLGGKRREAIIFFVKTLVTFAVITAIGLFIAFVL